MSNQRYRLDLLMVLVTLGGALLAGCSASPDGEGAAASAPPLSALPRDVPIVGGESGEAVSWEAMLTDLTNADVVVIGELHGHPVGLPLAAAIYDDLVDRVVAVGRKPALSMEFFERDEQVALDDYLTGVTDEAAFLEASGRTESNYPAGHRAMVEKSREVGAPVIAANSPRRYARLARTDGYDRLRGLSGAQRAMFVVPDDLPTGAYRDRFYEVMGAMRGHEAGGGEGQSEEDAAEAERRLNRMVLSFFRAQTVWDETMADSIASALSDGSRPVVQVVGRFHSDFEGGLISGVRSRVPGARIVTISMLDAGSFGEEDRGRADYVALIGTDDEEMAQAE